MFQPYQKRSLCQYLSWQAKKLVLISANSFVVTETSKEGHVSLERVSYIHYPLRFQKDTIGVRALIDSDGEINAMILIYAAKLGLKLHLTTVVAQKIDSSTLKTFGMVLATFQMKDKLGKARFFQETFLVANINAKIVLGIPFLTFSNADI